ncbi:MAG TPA: BON domain-containing protein [Nitrospiraceae bacterium]|jgi:hyperosmotically inducible periplasmic protein|nr:BON domain-containing protein [Nitrospiraceae bacterium]
MQGLRVWFALWLLLSVACSGCSSVIGSTSNDAPRDGTISKEVETKLASDQFGGLAGIMVTTEAGVVTLLGTVETADQKARAADLTRQVNGVKRVKNNIDIHRKMPE